MKLPVYIIMAWNEFPLPARNFAIRIQRRTGLYDWVYAHENVRRDSKYAFDFSMALEGHDRN